MCISRRKESGLELKDARGRGEMAEIERPATLPQLAEEGNLKKLKRALTNEPERVNEVDKQGQSALMWALTKAQRSVLMWVHR